MSDRQRRNQVRRRQAQPLSESEQSTFLDESARAGGVDARPAPTLDELDRADIARVQADSNRPNAPRGLVMDDDDIRARVSEIRGSANPVTSTGLRGLPRTADEAASMHRIWRKIPSRMCHLCSRTQHARPSRKRAKRFERCPSKSLRPRQARYAQGSERRTKCSHHRSFTTHSSSQQPSLQVATAESFPQLKREPRA